jgi:hypothetical protein
MGVMERVKLTKVKYTEGGVHREILLNIDLKMNSGD